MIISTFPATTNVCCLFTWAKMTDIEKEASSLLLDYVPKDKDSKIFVVLGASVGKQIR